MPVLQQIGLFEEDQGAIFWLAVLYVEPIWLHLDLGMQLAKWPFLQCKITMFIFADGDEGFSYVKPERVDPISSQIFLRKDLKS